MALAVTGFALITYRLIAHRDTRFLPAAVLVIVGVPVYLYDTNITPDQLWATRRFVPFVLPVFVIGAVWAADRLVAAVSSGGVSRHAPTLVLATSLLVPSVAATWPLRHHTEQRGAHAAIESLCAELGSDAIVLDLDGGAFSMPVRGWCGVDVGSIAIESTASARTFAERTREVCAPAFTVSAVSDRIDQLDGDVEFVTSYTVTNPHMSESTLITPPDSYVDQAITWTLGRVVLPGGVRRLIAFAPARRGLIAPTTR